MPESWQWHFKKLLLSDFIVTLIPIKLSFHKIFVKSIMCDRPSSVGTNGTSSLPMQGFGEASYLRFIIKFVCTWRFWLQSDITKRRFSRGSTYVYEMSLFLMFIINADCILCEARDENEGNIEDTNKIIEQYQYFTISEASISNLLVRVRYRENS